MQWFGGKLESIEVFIMVKRKCDFCGKKVENLVEYTDVFDSNYNICDECNAKVKTGRCRKCNGILGDAGILGLCMNCSQSVIHTEEKKKQDAQQGLGNGGVEVEDGLVVWDKLTDEEFLMFQMIKNSSTNETPFTFRDLEKNKALRYLWIKVKLNASGIFDNETILKYSPEIEELLERNMVGLRGNKCKLLVITNENGRKAAREYGSVIDCTDNILIVKV